MATLCESIVCFQLLLIRISQKHLNNVTCIFVVDIVVVVFQFKQLRGVVTMALNPLYGICVI